MSGDVPPPIEVYKVLISTYISATSALLFTFPLDTLKTRLQTTSKSALACTTDIIKYEGMRGFYRGIPASLISAAPARSFTMSLYTSLISKYANWLDIGMQSELDRPTIPVFLAGLSAGSLSCSFTAPFEFTKTASQVETLINKSPVKPGAIHAVKRIWQKGGIKMLYGGVEYQCLRDSIGSGVYFTVYETVKNKISQWTRKNEFEKDDRPNGIAIATAGALCGATSWVVIYPIDTMKSEYQKNLYSSALLHEPEKVERPKFKFSLDMYRGLGFSIVRTALNGVLIFTFFEYIQWML